MRSWGTPLAFLAEGHVLWGTYALAANFFCLRYRFIGEERAWGDEIAKPRLGDRDVSKVFICLPSFFIACNPGARSCQSTAQHARVRTVSLLGMMKRPTTVFCLDLARFGDNQSKE